MMSIASRMAIIVISFPLEIDPRTVAGDGRQGSINGPLHCNMMFRMLRMRGLAFRSSTKHSDFRREAMQELWERAGLTSIETFVIHIPVTYSSFKDFWDSNTVPIGTQGQINRKHVNESNCERLCANDYRSVQMDGLLIKRSQTP
jgi:hypothetical protein